VFEYAGQHGNVVLGGNLDQPLRAGAVRDGFGQVHQFVEGEVFEERVAGHGLFVEADGVGAAFLGLAGQLFDDDRLYSLSPLRFSNWAAAMRRSCMGK
jgi:hypothetical protein